MIELNKAGYEAYVVGGFVRDSVLGLHKKVSDYDITTSAKPNKVKEIFVKDNQFNIGEKHGTIGIRRKGITYEITTYRIESKYSDGRHPDIVEFVEDLRLDLGRRDFTINALAADKDGEVIDKFTGLEDLEEGLIRTVGNPLDRFEEDSLRMFRAIRFAVRFGFNIEIKTFNAINNNIHLLNEHTISGERVYSELSGIIKHLKQGIQLLDDVGLLRYLFDIKLDSTQHQYLEELNCEREELTVKWCLFFDLILYKFNLNSKINVIIETFERFPGIGNNNLKQILDLIEILELMRNIPNMELGNLSKLMIYHIYKNKRSNLGTDEYFNLIKQVVNCLQFDPSIIKMHILESAIDFYTPISPLNGNIVKDYGYKGKTIGLIIELINYLQIFGSETDTTEYLARLDEKIKHGIILDFSILDANLQIPSMYLEFTILPITLLSYRLIRENQGYIIIRTKNKEIIVELDAKLKHKTINTTILSNEPNSGNSLEITFLEEFSFTKISKNHVSILYEPILDYKIPSDNEFLLISL